MSRDREHKPGAQLALPSLWAQPPVAPVSFFAMPTDVPTGGEVVVLSQQPLVAREQRPWSPPLQAGLVAGQSADLVSQQQVPPQGQVLADQNRAQLQRLCRRLRETHRCPGQCVLSRARQDRLLRQFPDLR